MSRPFRVSEAQDQLLTTALDLYRMAYRLHRSYQGLPIPFEIVRDYDQAEGRGDEPPTLALAVAEEIAVTIDEFQDIADRLQKAACATDVSVRSQWREDRERWSP